MAQLGAKTGWEVAVPHAVELPTRKRIGVLRTRLASIDAKRAA